MQVRPLISEFRSLDVQIFSSDIHFTISVRRLNLKLVLAFTGTGRKPFSLQMSFFASRWAWRMSSCPTLLGGSLYISNLKIETSSRRGRCLEELNYFFLYTGLLVFTLLTTLRTLVSLSPALREKFQALFF